MTSFIGRFSSLRRLNVLMYVIEKEAQSVSFIERFFLFSEVKMYLCMYIIEKGPQSVSFIERFSSLWRLNVLMYVIEKGAQSVSL